MPGFFLGMVTWAPSFDGVVTGHCRADLLILILGVERCRCRRGRVVLIRVRLLLSMREEGSSVTVTDRCVSRSGPSFWLVAAVLLPLGAAHNIRLVILNRRDYAGSTKYSEENLKDLVAGDKSFMERLALEVKHFLLWFIDTYRIPKITADRKSGGFAIMGWSMGNATAFSLLGYPDVVGNKSYW